MKPLNDSAPLDDLEIFLAHLSSKGAKLFTKDAELHYRAPKGALCSAEIDRLQRERALIVKLLARSAASGAEPPLEPRGVDERVPLTYTQRTAWRIRRLDQQLSARTVVLGLRIRGRLDAARFAESLAWSIDRHEALRTRIAMLDGAPAQQIVQSQSFPSTFLDLTALPAHHRDEEAQRLAAELLLAPIRVTVDALCASWLLQLDGDDHLFILGMDHLVSDAVSTQILQRDLTLCYMALSAGKRAALPEVGVQFADFAVWQKKAQSAWLARHDKYWRDRLENAHRLRFPQEISSSVPGPARCITFSIDRNLRERLLAWSRKRRATLVQSAFTAFTALVLRWCGVREGIFLYQSDGRLQPKIENTVGFFASVLHLRVTLGPEDTFVDLLERNKAEYCDAHDHYDFSYVTAQDSYLDCLSNPGFNWVPSAAQAGVRSLADSVDEVQFFRTPVQLPLKDGAESEFSPTVIFKDHADIVEGKIYFCRDRISPQVIESFSRDLLVFMHALMEEPPLLVDDVILSS